MTERTRRISVTLNIQIAVGYAVYCNTLLLLRHNSLDLTAKFEMVEGHGEVFEKSIHTEQPSDREIFLEGSVDSHGVATRYVKTYLMHPTVGRSPNSSSSL